MEMNVEEMYAIVERDNRIKELEEQVKKLKQMINEAADWLSMDEDDSAYNAMCALGYEC